MKQSSSSDEQVIFSVKRNAIGLINTYLIIIIGLGFSLGLVIWASNEVFDFDITESAIALFATLIIGAVTVLQLLVVTIIYWSNTLTLTQDEVRQVLQTGIFSKKTSRLGLPNIEDVTVSQKGPLATALNYGTIRIETAGEQSNFDFKYCSDPSECAKIIMDTRIHYLESENNTVKSKDLQR